MVLSTARGEFNFILKPCFLGVTSGSESLIVESVFVRVVFNLWVLVTLLPYIDVSV